MIEGRYFDARTSAPHPARLSLSADGRLRLESPGGIREAALDAVRISDRIANVPRRITFDDGAVFESVWNDAIDAALDAAGRGGFGRRLGRWERLWPVAAAALAGVAILCFAFLKSGLPWLAGVAARALPPAVDAKIGSEGLELLDRTLLEPSRLPAVRGRHALRILLQNAGTAALAVAVLGDIGSASSLAAAVPVLLVQAKHSRDFEREADAHARGWLRQRGLPESHFDDVMCRMARDEPGLSYLSTHPPLRERAACAQRRGASR